MPEANLNGNVVHESIDKHIGHQEYIASDMYQRALDGRAAALGLGILCGVSGTAAAETAINHADKPVIVITALASLAFAGASLKIAKATFMGAFHIGYTNGHNNALNEASSDINNTLDAVTGPSNN